jgi:hypothetical protein
MATAKAIPKRRNLNNRTHHRMHITMQNTQVQLLLLQAKAVAEPRKSALERKILVKPVQALEDQEVKRPRRQAAALREEMSGAAAVVGQHHLRVKQIRRYRI